MNESNSNEKLKLIRDIMDYVLNNEFTPEQCAAYVYIKSLDEKSYRYKAQELSCLLDRLGGMSAGDEFHYPKKEVMEMLNTYESSIRK